jgi:Leucine-rich repeat (LRR) protein
VLDLSNCFLSVISPRAFKGLERSLEVLDLSANHLRMIPDDLLDDFDLIRKLKLNDNMLTLSPNVSFNGFRFYFVQICPYRLLL